MGPDTQSAILKVVLTNSKFVDFRVNIKRRCPQDTLDHVGDKGRAHGLEAKTERARVVVLHVAHFQPLHRKVYEN